MQLGFTLMDQLRRFNLQGFGQIEKCCQGWCLHTPFQQTDIGPMVTALKPQILLGQGALLPPSPESNSKCPVKIILVLILYYHRDLNPMAWYKLEYY